MEERYYINATDLAKVRIVKGILYGTISINSEIVKEDYITVMRILDKWEDALSSKVS